MKCRIFNCTEKFTNEENGNAYTGYDFVVTQKAESGDSVTKIVRVYSKKSHKIGEFVDVRYSRKFGNYYINEPKENEGK